MENLDCITKNCPCGFYDETKPYSCCLPEEYRNSCVLRSEQVFMACPVMECKHWTKDNLLTNCELLAKDGAVDVSSCPDDITALPIEKYRDLVMSVPRAALYLKEARGLIASSLTRDGAKSVRPFIIEQCLEKSL